MMMHGLENVKFAIKASPEATSYMITRKATLSRDRCFHKRNVNRGKVVPDNVL
jgi:hypothetical protein